MVVSLGLLGSDVPGSGTGLTSYGFWYGSSILFISCSVVKSFILIILGEIVYNAFSMYSDR